MSAPEQLSENPARIELEGEDGIAIRQFVPADAPRIFSVINYDPDHLRQVYSGVMDETADKYQTEEDVLESIIHPRLPSDVRYRFGIWDGQTMVGSDNVEKKGNGRGKLGSYIGKKYLGHNYAARARVLLARFAFDQLDLEEVYSEILVDNQASRRSLEKSGFTYGGIVEENRWIYTLRRDDQRPTT